MAEEQKTNGVQSPSVAPNIGEKTAMIENAAISLTKQAKEQNKKFDENGFRAAAKIYLENHETLAGFDTSAFLHDKENTYNGPGHGFTLKEENGQIVAVGSDGTVIRAGSFEEINDKVCQNLKQKAIAMGKEPKIGFNSNNPERHQIFAHDAIIKHHMTIIAGGPKDPQFWKNLKQEFLSDKNNSLELWEKLTRNIPNEVMLRTPEEMERNNKLLQVDGIDRLRGTNSFVPQTAPRATDQSNTAPSLQNTIGINTPQEVSMTPTSLPLPGTNKQNDKNIILQMRMGVNPYLEQSTPRGTMNTPSVTRQLTPEMVQQLRKQRQI